MKQIISKFIKVCPKSGKFRGFRNITGLSRLLFPIIGLAALIWILVRVIPKPSRINYPCIKTAMPLASGLLGYILIFILSAAAFLKSKKSFVYYPLFLFAASLVFSFSGSSLVSIESSEDIKLPTINLEPNQPMGEAKGIFPGRVVWAYDPNATNENCNPTSIGHAWWMPENNNQDVIDGMVSKVIQSLTGETTNKSAWDAIFKYHNKTRGKGSVSYTAGEKIFIKINNVSGWGGNFNTSDLSVVTNGSYGISETSPQIILSVLRQLINVVGVADTDIYVGDPMRNIYKHSYVMWHSEFPDVHYISHDNYSHLGREQVVASTTAKIYYSDKGTVLRENVWDVNRPGGAVVYDDYLYTIFEDVEYLLNIPMLKGHKRAGMTMFAKNHFGSHTRNDASHLHNGVVDPIELNNSTSRREYGMYRVQVDLMGSKYLGGKTLFYLMDALWAADQEISFPKKFQIPPFNNDWMSSVFASLDPVAIESVGYDFLRSEFTSTRNVGDGAGTYPQKPAADDYLHQASDTTLWAEGIRYDPENDGTVIGSLGTHEHWNDAILKQYSRNLDSTGQGIELVKTSPSTYIEENTLNVSNFKLYQNYPNPFNPSTKISYSISERSNVSIKVYDMLGREVAELVNSMKDLGSYEATFDAANLASGLYIYTIKAGNFTASKKMMLMK